MPRKPATVLTSVAMGALLSMTLAACSPAIVESPSDQALALAEKWADLSAAGSEDALQGLACSGLLGGGNADHPEVESHTFEVEDRGGGDFDVFVTSVIADYPDLHATLRIETEDELCIKRIK